MSVKSARSKVSMCSSKVDILSPLLKEPLRKGWRREVVYRSIVDSQKRNNTCDIYYFTPDGKKLRSRPDVLKYLNGSNSCFSINNFSFFKEPIGMDGDQEICRIAGTKSPWCDDAIHNQSKKKSKKKNIVKVQNSSPTRCLSESENNVEKMAKTRSRDDEKAPCSQIGVEHENKNQPSIRKRLQPKKLQESHVKVSSSSISPPRLRARNCDSTLSINLDDESSPLFSVHDCEDKAESSDENQEKADSSGQQSAPVLSRLSAPAMPLPETLSLYSPQIALLPLGTTLVLSGPSTLRIIPQCTTSTSSVEVENTHPRCIPSPPPSAEISVVAESPKTSIHKPGTSKKTRIATSCTISTPIIGIKNNHPKCFPSPSSSAEISVVAESSKTSNKKPDRSKKIKIATSCTISTPVKVIKNNHPKCFPSPPSSSEISVVAESPKTSIQKPATSKKTRIATSCTISTPVIEIKSNHPKFFPSPPSNGKTSVEAESSKTSNKKPDTSKKIQIATSCTISRPIIVLKNLYPKPSTSSSAENSVVADSSTTSFIKPDTYMNTRKRLRESQATATILAPKTSSSADGFAVPPSPSPSNDFKNHTTIPEFGILVGNQNRSYWNSIGEALIKEGIQKAIRSNTSAAVGDNPISVTRPKSVKVRGVKKTAVPPVTMTCEEYFALRKRKREEKLKESQIKSIASTVKTTK